MSRGPRRSRRCRLRLRLAGWLVLAAYLVAALRMVPSPRLVADLITEAAAGVTARGGGSCCGPGCLCCATLGPEACACVPRGGADRAGAAMAESGPPSPKAAWVATDCRGPIPGFPTVSTPSLLLPKMELPAQRCIGFAARPAALAWSTRTLKPPQAPPRAEALDLPPRLINV